MCLSLLVHCENIECKLSIFDLVYRKLVLWRENRTISMSQLYCRSMLLKGGTVVYLVREKPVLLFFSIGSITLVLESVVPASHDS